MVLFSGSFIENAENKLSSLEESKTFLKDIGMVKRPKLKLYPPLRRCSAGTVSRSKLCGLYTTIKTLLCSSRSFLIYNLYFVWSQDYFIKQACFALTVFLGHFSEKMMSYTASCRQLT